MQLKMRKTDAGETLEWTDYMSLSFTQHVSKEKIATYVMLVPPPFLP
jgi:steroid 3-oxidase